MATSLLQPAKELLASCYCCAASAAAASLSSGCIALLLFRAFVQYVEPIVCTFTCIVDPGLASPAHSIAAGAAGLGVVADKPCMQVGPRWCLRCGCPDSSCMNAITHITRHAVSLLQHHITLIESCNSNSFGPQLQL